MPDPARAGQHHVQDVLEQVVGVAVGDEAFDTLDVPAQCFVARCRSRAGCPRVSAGQIDEDREVGAEHQLVDRPSNHRRRRHTADVFVEPEPEPLTVLQDRTDFLNDSGRLTICLSGVEFGVCRSPSANDSATGPFGLPAGELLLARHRAQHDELRSRRGKPQRKPRTRKTTGAQRFTDGSRCLSAPRREDLRPCPCHDRAGQHPNHSRVRE